MNQKILKLRNTYYNQDLTEVHTEVILFWKKVLLLQEASKKSMEEFCQAQKENFEKYKIDPFSEQALSSLITDSALVRARCFGLINEVDEEISKISNMEAYKAKNIYTSYKAEYYPYNKSNITNNLIVWKKVIQSSKQANVNLADYIKAQFIWCRNKGQKLPWPSVIASEEGLNRSLLINKTIM